ncbi:hypothetical protein [Clostridium sp. AWRP]|uniref:hypothetical protein n=1 Tax=Clostridium sp. AWRP TaxID=2212991 RepID=UPI000FD976BC|nr:hypothetical protein [Clostridium sp. AWRP]AZV56817.1 hypothetical protein DMR38_09525 [Clostridium sp. AWRP]
MITERDKRILKWIENFNSITIDQCSKLFFSTSKMSYDLARKRLRYLNREGAIKRYRKDPKSETVYFMDKRLKVHDLKILDVIVALQQFNTTTNEIILQNKIQINQFISYIVDATIVIGNDYPILIEVDYTHYTNDKKIINIINHLEGKHNRKYVFLIVRQTIEEVSVENVGMKSKLVLVNWKFNSSDKLLRSLRSLLEP